MKAAWVNVMGMNAMGTKTTLTALVALCVFAGSGCATKPTGAVQAQPEVASMSNVERYRRAVNVNAERKNVLVQWVNPPKEKDLAKYDEEEN